MSWFDDQIKERMQNDDELFTRAFSDMAEIIVGKLSFSLPEDSEKNKNAIGAILKYYHIPATDIPKEIKTLEDSLEYAFHPSGVMRRSVALNPGWHKNAIGPMLSKNRQGELVALIPNPTSGYWYFDSVTQKKCRVTQKNEADLGEAAYCFYKPLPPGALKVFDLLKYMINVLSKGDIFLIALATFCITLIGLIGPYINKILFKIVVPSGSMQLLVPLAITFIGFTLSSQLIETFKRLVLARLQDKLRISVASATIMRVLNLPLTFFNQYSPGELLSRMRRINNTCQILLDTIFTTGFTALFSLIYIVQIFSFTPSLALPAIAIIAITAGYSVISIFAMTGYQKRRMQCFSQTSGVNYALVSGISKIKLTGSEKRAFSKWSNTYAKAARLEFKPPWFVLANDSISYALVLFGTLILYLVAGQNKISPSDYMAFNASYALVSAAFMALANILINIAKIKPALDLAAPILEALPEVESNKTVITHLMGGVELNNLSYRYDKDSPYVLNNLSLKIRCGEYIAIVGKSGCGKSTLLRMLLGFLTPERGGVYYDGRDLETIDFKSLRQKIGVVTQNDKLFEGDIYSNITICAPYLTEEEAWKYAEIAGLSDDIKKMPKGMHTFISESGSGISGGQRQRLLIARAIAPKPRILIFDEATSALDNITQKKVSTALDALKCTRIIVAHRLSTIKNCDRILVLDNGNIVENGKYDDLLAQNGIFTDLVHRQLDSNLN